MKQNSLEPDDRTGSRVGENLMSVNGDDHTEPLEEDRQG
jgi:hypothetical protein